LTKELSQKKIEFYLFGLNLLIIFLGLLVLFWKRDLLPEKVPLFYSRPWGEEQLSPNIFLFLIPVLSLFVLFFNFQAIKFLFKKNKRLLFLITVGFSLLFSILGTTALCKIIFLIT